jgi:hypothetical protein
VETSERNASALVEIGTGFVHWTPVIAGALVAAAFSVVLITFGTALGLSVISTAPTWREASAALALLSGLYLLLAAIVSFGFGGYIAGRLRTSWSAALHDEFIEFRDGAHGLLAWALAVVISGVVGAAMTAAVATKAAPPATAPAVTAGEALIAYDLDRLFAPTGAIWAILPTAVPRPVASF